MGVAGTLLIQAQRKGALDEAVDRAATLLGSLAVPCGISLATGATERLDGYLAEVAQAGGRHMRLVSVMMLDHKGITMAFAGDESTIGDEFLERATEKETAMWRRSRNSSGTLMLQVSMPAVSGLRWGTLVAAFDLTPVEKRMAFTRNLLIGAGVAFMLTMLAVLYIGLSKIVVYPIRKLGGAAAALEKGDWSARADVESGDELGRAASAFNAMAAELQVYTEDLERKVEERSAEVRVTNQALRNVNQQLTDAVDELEQLVITDPLTGIYNRRYFAEILDFELRRSSRAKHPMTLIMIDVDHFGEFNNRHGHQAGDEVLKHVASVFSENLRSTDILARYGGEEFVVLLLDTKADRGVNIADKLRLAVGSFSFPVGVGQPLAQVTVSAGVAGFPDDADEPESLVRCADSALFAAKGAGRNRVEVWDPSLSDILSSTVGTLDPVSDV